MDRQPTGIEALNVYGGRACVSVSDLFAARGLDASRFDNLMMDRKSVAYPYEDTVTNAVNAAKPILDGLDDDTKGDIDLLIVATESGIDFGKSAATYVHKLLGLKPNCRVFELKQACYGGTAALQMAVGQIASGLGRRALVIATDVAWPSVKLSYAEPSQGMAAAALLVGPEPAILDIDLGAVGIHAMEALDTCRPDDRTETGDPDLSLMCYMDSLDAAFSDYADKVDGVCIRETFSGLAFHTPFGGMVKGAHRTLMRRRAKMKGPEIDADFAARVAPSLTYCMQIGNAYSAAVFIALAGLIEQKADVAAYRVGLFSYGSGCCAEFYSGVVPNGARARLGQMGIAGKLAERDALDVAAYDRLTDQNNQLIMGTKDFSVDRADFKEAYERQFEGRGLAVLTGIDAYHRQYAWS
ncbi:hydroxymethylglutaryl-CoA synthase [Breoghania sp. L-A4]|uniref:hydroxymethylglutaryl-CoA synthase family protein n=1 Tax=Breoghania sp. L-A4 TaxID=2304600 RepID=UPI000E3599A8|nr:hydroxymethylglutaryl-CoA synthase [Breoghania sp. L-A4]AXS40793.1 hydroxymethylglutaryl-CoA synthase family protein [Breoghania sp. L-A4]